MTSDFELAVEEAVAMAGAAAFCSEGRNFRAGADFSIPGLSPYSRHNRHLYDHALDLFAQPLPLVVAVQGKAVGRGFGLA